jgi:hypothetical protein
VDCAPIKHRRHASNVSGTKQNTIARYIRDRPSLGRHRKWLHRVLQQCEAFDRLYSAQMQGEAKRLFAVLARVRQSNWFVRRYLLFRNGVWTTGFGRNLGYFLAH